MKSNIENINNIIIYVINDIMYNNIWRSNIDINLKNLFANQQGF